MVGAALTWIGSILIVRLTERSQRLQRFELVRAFSADTVSNITQIIRDLHSLRQRTNAIQIDVVLLLDVEIGVFSRNREHIIALPPGVRGRLREFVNSVAIQRAIVQNSLQEFYQQTQLAEQLKAAGNYAQHEKVKAAADLPLGNARRAADNLHSMVTDGNKLVADLGAVRPE